MLNIIVRVHVKYQGDASIQGPPIIMLTNDGLEKAI